MCLKKKKTRVFKAVIFEQKLEQSVSKRHAKA